jgi:hypothetical protein
MTGAEIAAQHHQNSKSAQRHRLASLTAASIQTCRNALMQFELAGRVTLRDQISGGLHATAIPWAEVVHATAL